MFIREVCTIKVNDKPIDRAGYYEVTVTTSHDFEFKIPCRGYSLASQMRFQDTLKYSTYIVEQISEKRFKELQR